MSVAPPRGTWALLLVKIETEVVLFADSASHWDLLAIRGALAFILNAEA